MMSKAKSTGKAKAKLKGKVNASVYTQAKKSRESCVGRVCSKPG
jgi:hypothetical protein